MRVIITAGGTGGHIYPALAIINKIKAEEPNSEFLYIGTHNRMEKDIIPKHNIPFVAIEMYGFSRTNPFKNIKTFICLLKAYRKSRQIISDFKPDIVIGVGGYVTVPVIKEAKKLGYKTFIHEQNSLLGKANKYVLPYADKVGVSFKSTLSSLPADKAIYTGNPCGDEAKMMEPILKSEFGLNPSKKLVLIVMGSLGSVRINNYMKEILPYFKDKEYEVLFITGNNYHESFKQIKLSSNVHILPYIDKMPRVMKQTDLMISRAGASTLSEIIALKVPTILIPSPYVTDNHQYKNAVDLETKECALILNENDLKTDALIKTIDNLINDNKKLNQMKANYKHFEINNSSLIIYNTIRDLVKRK